MKKLFVMFLTICALSHSCGFKNNALYTHIEAKDDSLGLDMSYPYFVQEYEFLNDEIEKRFKTVAYHKNYLIDCLYFYAHERQDIPITNDVSIEEKLEWLMENNITQEGYDMSYSLKYDIAVSKGVISILFTEVDYSGGGCGNHTKMFSINYDTKAKKFLTLFDVSNFPVDYLDEYCIDYAKRNCHEKIDSGSVEIFQKNESRYDTFTYRNKKIVIYIQPYVLASGAEGVIKIPVFTKRKALIGKNRIE